MAIPTRAKDQILVLTEKKQTTFGTAITDANLQAGKRVAPLAALFGQFESRHWADADVAMKGHDYVTTVSEVERAFAEALPLLGDSYLLAWAFAFAMGKVSSVQPNAAGNPTAWRHTIKPQDAAADGKDLPVTTLYIETAATANLKRRLIDLAVRELSLEFPPAAPMQVMAQLMGSGRDSSGALASPPALMALNLLYSNNLVFKYGTQGAPADITSEIVRGSIRFGFAWNFDEENQRHAGAGLYGQRAWLTAPALTLEFQRHVDAAASAAFDDWKALTVRELSIKVSGATIGSGPEVHDFELKGLALKPSVQRIGQSGDKTVYQYTVGPADFIKEGTNDVVQVIVTNTQSAYLGAG